MGIYLLNLAIVTVGSYFAENMAKKRSYFNDGKVNYYFFIIVLLCLICISGFRYKVGTDYGNYSEIYTYFGMQPVDWSGSEVGFDFLVKSLYKITTNPQILFLVTSIIINIGIVFFLKNYSSDFTLSMYLYITTFLYYGTMNGIRQYVASAILISGFKYIVNGNFKKYLIFVFIAYLFHSSALIMIPIFFIVRIDTYSKINRVVLGVFIIAFLFYQQFLHLLFSVFGDSQYGYYESYLTDTSNGANILRIIVWVLPVVLFLIYRKKSYEIFADDMNIILNLCILGTLFMILAYRQVFFARFCMYFDVYYLLLLPRLCRLFDKKSNRLILYGIIVGYFMYSTILLLSGESQVYPYRYTLNLF